VDLFSSITSLADPAPPVRASALPPPVKASALQPARAAVEDLHPARPAPEDFHPALWRAHQLGRSTNAQQGVVASGYADLDAQLPGGGWPARVLTELLLPHAGVGELRLLAPALAALQRQQRSLMWFDPPAAPCAWALGALDIDVRQLVVVHSRGGQAGLVGSTGYRPGPKGRARALLPAADVLWALEQALKSGHLGAALAWLPARLPADALRRLQLAAQAHDGPVFLLRDAEQRSRPSAAPLRLLLGSAGLDRLRVLLLKRRGPPLAQALHLALAPVLSATALARAGPVRLPSLAGSAAAAAPLRRALPL
jgi:protein ImuA